MDDAARYGELRERLEAFGQEHLLAHWEQLETADRLRLATRIGQLDLRLVARLYSAASEPAAGEDWAAVAARAEPPPAVRLNTPAAQRRAARARGEAMLAAGELGVVLVAGGQGTRLGFNHPKGMYPIGPVSGATLFEILFAKLQAVRRRYGVAIPLWIMTSPATHDETAAYLAEHDYLGLPAADVRLFCQGTMPAVDAGTGRILMASAGEIAESPDGHGGMLRALAASGGLAQCEAAGIRRLFYFQVDNPLAKVCDPELLGFHDLARSELTTQVVAKQTPTERVGNVVLVDGRMQVIEYSDLPAEAGERRNPEGSLTLWAGSIAVHVFDVAFLVRMAAGDGRLPFHLARKKVPYLDDEGRTVQPSEPNAIKFEQFIFDLLPAAERPLAVEADEATSFAPLKNPPGSGKDSPEAVQAALVALHRGWLEAAGATVSPGVAVEISPLLALEAADLAGRLPPGLVVREPHYFR